MASNGSKPYQTALIARLGFLVPETLITTDPRAAAEFWEKHGQVVYKSVSSVRSIVCRLTEAHRARLEDVTWCPTQFQAYVPGRDHRVHVVGDEVFPVEVVSDADDYRYATAQGASCELFATALPSEVADRARAVAKALDLPVCGIDSEEDARRPMVLLRGQPFALLHVLRTANRPTNCRRIGRLAGRRCSKGALRG